MIKLLLPILLLLLSLNTQANFEEIKKLAKDIPEAQTLVDGREYLESIKERVKEGKDIPKKPALKKAEELESIGKKGCKCETQEIENMIKSQAYTQAAAIYGVLSKQSFSVKLGLKSFNHLETARELDSDNTDALKGQAVALNMILSKNGFIQRMAGMALGLNLKDAARELIKDLRASPERSDLQYWARQLEKRL